MAMMGWSNPKTAMVYVKKSRMTSLSLSMYLTNVQRTNCSNPFPRSPLDRREVGVQKKQVSKSVVYHPTSEVETLGRSDLKVEDPEVELATQELLREIEAEEGGKVVEVEELACSSSSSIEVSGNGWKAEQKIGEGQTRKEKDSSHSIPLVDPRMAGILHNLQNSGNVTINFNFDNCKK
jgi:hypothetical protein